MGNNKVMQSSFMSTSSKKLVGQNSLSGSKQKPEYQSAYPLGKTWKGEKESVDRHKNIIEKLQNTLEIEKKKLKQSRLMYAREMQAKTELEELLFQCVEEVKNEIQTKKAAEKLPPGKKKVIDKIEYTKEQREKIVEMLLSQERVLALLYDKTFPTKQEEGVKEDKKEEQDILASDEKNSFEQQ